jgi:Fusaric acid resistance protein-like
VFAVLFCLAHPGGHANTIAENQASRVAKGLVEDPANAAFEAPLGHYGIRESIYGSMTSSSIATLAAVRVGLAATFAVVISVALGFDRAYWMVAASVLVLHQGLDWSRTFQRSIERVVGTFLGLGFAGALLSLHLTGAYLVAVLTVLQFVIEMAVLRSYALAVVFITAMALVIGSGGYAEHDLGHLLWVSRRSRPHWPFLVRTPQRGRRARIIRIGAP